MPPSREKNRVAVLLAAFVRCWLQRVTFRDLNLFGISHRRPSCTLAPCYDVSNDSSLEHQSRATILAVHHGSASTMSHWVQHVSGSHHSALKTGLHFTAPVWASPIIQCDMFKCQFNCSTMLVLVSAECTLSTHSFLGKLPKPTAS